MRLEVASTLMVRGHAPPENDSNEQPRYKSGADYWCASVRPRLSVRGIIIRIVLSDKILSKRNRTANNIFEEVELPIRIRPHYFVTERFEAELLHLLHLRQKHVNDHGSSQLRKRTGKWR